MKQRSYTNLDEALKDFDQEAPQEKPGKSGTVVDKVKQDNGWWILVQFDGEKEPRWVHESKISKVEDN